MTRAPKQSLNRLSVHQLQVFFNVLFFFANFMQNHWYTTKSTDTPKLKSNPKMLGSLSVLPLYSLHVKRIDSFLSIPDEECLPFIPHGIKASLCVRHKGKS